MAGVLQALGDAAPGLAGAAGDEDGGSVVLMTAVNRA
jgi:hypothetical protein